MSQQPTVVLTRQLIEDGMSRNGGWSNQQFALLGVKLPARRGWKKGLVGKSVPAEKYRRFLLLKDRHLEGKPESPIPAGKPSVPPQVVARRAVTVRTVDPLADPLNVTLHFDGSCDANPGGTMRFGWFAARADGVLLGNGSGPVGGYEPEQRTNNVAEYEAIIRGLEWIAALANPIDTLVIYGDSQLVVRQVNREWKNRKPHLQRLMDRVHDLLARMDAGHVELTWVPREQNEEADRLSKRPR